MWQIAGRGGDALDPIFAAQQSHHFINAHLSQCRGGEFKREWNAIENGTNFDDSLRIFFCDGELWLVLASPRDE